jgi:Ca-activated chloride channel homolog
MSGWAAGLIVVDEAHWPGPVPPIHPPPDRPWPRPMPPPRVYAFAPLELNRHQAEVKITDQVAVTSIEQEFYNPNDRQIEGTFLLPLPKGAQIRKFSMEIDGKPAQAELLGADKARGIYEDIVRKLKDPALLEYAERDVYKVRIFPIEPRSKKRVSLSYTELLRSDSGLVGYTYPLSPGKFAAKPIPMVSLKLEVKTRQPLKSIYSPTHNVEIRRHDSNAATLGYEASDARADVDFQLYFAQEKDEIGVHLMTYQAGSEDGYFLLLASPGIDAERDRIIPKDVVFVLDTSGSMAGRKLEQARNALLFCVENLNPEDRFEIVRFSTEAEPLFRALTKPSEAGKEQARGFIQDLKATGGTAINEALVQALGFRPRTGDRPYVIVFLTDGLPTVGVTQEDQILTNVKKANTGNTRVFCFGIGHDVNTHLLDKITEETRAFSQYVLPEEDLEIKVSNFFSKIKDPVLTSPSLDFSGGVRVSKLYPSPLPDLFRGEQLVLVGRYSGGGPAAATLKGKVNEAPRSFTHDLNFAINTTEHDFIPRLWATRRVGYLLDEIRLRGENVELRDEITDLARRYAIVTPYTSYLIVEDEARRGIPEMTQSLPQLQRDRVARQAAGDSYDRAMVQRYGIGPVASARSQDALKSASAPQAAINLGAYEAQRGTASAGPASVGPSGGPVPASRTLTGGMSPAAGVPATGQSASAQFVNGRTFFFNDGQWIDGSIQRLKDPRRIKVTVGSREYFDLIEKLPESRGWLALGQQVQFAAGAIVYEIHQ